MWNLGLTHKHCFHTYNGIIHMVIPDGHILEKCCQCPTTRLVHMEHRNERTSITFQRNDKGLQGGHLHS
jgi:hypothetical protein